MDQVRSEINDMIEIGMVQHRLLKRAAKQKRSEILEDDCDSEESDKPVVTKD